MRVAVVSSSTWLITVASDVKRWSAVEIDAVSSATYPSVPRCRRGLPFVIKPFGLSHIILCNQSNEDLLRTETFWHCITRVFFIVSCFANDSKRTSRYRWQPTTSAPVRQTQTSAFNEAFDRAHACSVETWDLVVCGSVLPLTSAQLRWTVDELRKWDRFSHRLRTHSLQLAWESTATQHTHAQRTQS